MCHHIPGAESGNNNVKFNPSTHKNDGIPTICHNMLGAEGGVDSSDGILKMNPFANQPEGVQVQLPRKESNDDENYGKFDPFGNHAEGGAKMKSAKKESESEKGAPPPLYSAEVTQSVFADSRNTMFSPPPPYVCEENMEESHVGGHCDVICNHGDGMTSVE